MTLTDRCCEAMREDGYCREHFPLGGDYTAINAAMAAEAAAREAQAAAGLLPPVSRRELQRLARQARWGSRRNWGHQRRG